MNQIDIRSMLIGTLLTIIVVGAMAASGNGHLEKFQLHNLNMSAENPVRISDDGMSISLAGVLKIDTETGQVWGLTLRNNKADKWLEMK